MNSYYPMSKLKQLQEWKGKWNMSKSIYEEALDILFNSFSDPQDEDDDCYMFNRNQMNKISKAIREAQKQEKLLNKIKEIIDRQDDSYIVSMLEESKRYHEIEKLDWSDEQ